MGIRNILCLFARLVKLNVFAMFPLSDACYFYLIPQKSVVHFQLLWLHSNNCLLLMEAVHY